MILSAAHRPLNPPFRRAPGASVKTARRMRRHLPGSFWVPFCGKKVQNTRDIVADFSVLLMSTDARSTSRDRLRVMPCQKEENERSEVKSTKTIRMSLSREQPPTRVERVQQEQDYAASRSGHAGCRLFFFRCKRECGLFSPRFAANDSRLAKKAFKKMRTKSASGGDGLFTNPRIVARSQR